MDGPAAAEGSSVQLGAPPTAVDSASSIFGSESGILPTEPGSGWFDPPMVAEQAPPPNKLSQPSSATIVGQPDPNEGGIDAAKLSCNRFHPERRPHGDTNGSRDGRGLTGSSNHQLTKSSVAVRGLCERLINLARHVGLGSAETQALRNADDPVFPSTEGDDLADRITPREVSAGRKVVDDDD